MTRDDFFYIVSTYSKWLSTQCTLGPCKTKMGGNALRHLHVQRRDLPEYLALKSYVLEIVREYYDLVATPVEPPGKTSFGDLDILVASPKGTSKRMVYHDERLRSRGVVINGKVTSFEHDGFQIDLITVPSTSFELAKVYYHLCFGWIMGRFARKLGFTFGHESFGIKFANTTYFELSRDVDAIMTYFGFPRFPERGFADCDEMVAYLTSGRFDLRILKGKPFELRRRAVVRPDLVDISARIDALDGEAVAEVENLHEDAIRYFGREEAYMTFEEVRRHADHVRAVFNGHIIRALTGLEDQRLGDFIRRFTARYTTDHILELARHGTLEETIMSAFKEFI